MDEQIFKLVMYGLSLIQILVGFILRRLWSEIDAARKEREEIKKDLMESKLLMVERHPTKAEFQTMVSDIKHQMENGFNTLTATTNQMKDTIAKIFDKLERKADR